MVHRLPRRRLLRRARRGRWGRRRGGRPHRRQLPQGHGLRVMDLEGRAALVTGGSSGIGAAVVRRLQRAGSRVAVLDLQAEDGEGDLSLACGVAALVRVAARDLGPLRIRVNAVAPGTTDTPMFDAARRLPGYEEQVAARTPLGGLGSPGAVADAVVALAGLDWVTGQIVAADG